MANPAPPQLLAARSWSNPLAAYHPPMNDQWLASFQFEHELTHIVAEAQCTPGQASGFLRSHDEIMEQLKELFAKQSAAHEARIKALEGKLYNIAALGIVYAYPDDWSCATEGGPPEIQDYQRIDLALLAQKE